MKLFYSSLVFFNFIFAQDIIHEDFVLKIGETLYSPFSDKPFNGKVVKFLRLKGLNMNILFLME